MRRFSRLLVRHEQVMDRLRSEVLSVMGDAVHPSREQIRRMPYLASVVKESTRALLIPEAAHIDLDA